MEDGFYWVRLFEPGEPWTVGELRRGQWWVIGSDVGYDEVVEVGPPVGSPPRAG